MSSPTARIRWWSKITRDLVLFSLGLGLAIHETIFYTGPERPSTLIFITGLLGLVPVLRFEEHLRTKDRAK